MNDGDDHSQSSELSALSEDKATAVHAFPNKGIVRIYEKVNAEGPKLIGGFARVKRVVEFLGVRSKELTKMIISGTIYKEIYRFSSRLTRKMKGQHFGN